MTITVWDDFVLFQFLKNFLILVVLIPLHVLISKVKFVETPRPAALAFPYFVLFSCQSQRTKIG